MFTKPISTITSFLTQLSNSLIVAREDGLRFIHVNDVSSEMFVYSEVDNLVMSDPTKYFLVLLGYDNLGRDNENLFKIGEQDIKPFAINIKDKKSYLKVVENSKPNWNLTFTYFSRNYDRKFNVNAFAISNSCSSCSKVMGLSSLDFAIACKVSQKLLPLFVMERLITKKPYNDIMNCTVSSSDLIEESCVLVNLVTSLVMGHVVMPKFSTCYMNNKNKQLLCIIPKAGLQTHTYRQNPNASEDLDVNSNYSEFAEAFMKSGINSLIKEANVCQLLHSAMKSNSEVYKILQSTLIKTGKSINTTIRKNDNFDIERNNEYAKEIDNLLVKIDNEFMIEQILDKSSFVKRLYLFLVIDVPRNFLPIVVDNGEAKVTETLRELSDLSYRVEYSDDEFKSVYKKNSVVDANEKVYLERYLRKEVCNWEFKNYLSINSQNNVLDISSDILQTKNEPKLDLDRRGEKSYYSDDSVENFFDRYFKKK